MEFLGLMKDTSQIKISLTVKNSESNETLLRVVPEFSNNILEVNKIDRSHFIYIPGYTPSTNSVQLFAENVASKLTASNWWM